MSKLRFNIPLLSTDIISGSFSNSEIKTWYVIGHSKSGSAAHKQAAENKHINGVIFLGSYTQEDDLKLINKPVLSIWGTKDGILDFSKYDEYKKNMPSNAKFHEIIGGNNTNFADINLMQGDTESIIKPEEQKNITVEQIDLFIKNIK